MNRLLRVTTICALTVLALATPASIPIAAEEPATKKDTPASDSKKITVKPDALDDLVVKTDRITLNNFTLAERGEGLYGVRNKKLTMLELSWSMKNKTEMNCNMGFMIIGLDEKGEPLWALSSTVGADPKRTEAASAQCYAPIGILKKTASIRIIIEGDL